MVVQIYFLSISFLGLLLNQELSLNEYYCLSRLWDLHPWGFRETGRQNYEKLSVISLAFSRRLN